MSYAPVSKVLSTYTPTEEPALAMALAQRHAELVIHPREPHLRLHRRWYRHHVWHEGLVVLDMLLITQNRVGPHEVSPKTIDEYKINRK